MQFHSVRGARGVQMEEVWAAADTVLAQGERPTIERVRQQLGRGSPNTVGPMLDGWYGSLAKRLGAGPIEDAGAGAEADTLPAPVLRAAKALWARALQQSQEHAAHGLAAAQAGSSATSGPMSGSRVACPFAAGGLLTGRCRRPARGSGSRRRPRSPPRCAPTARTACGPW